MMRSMFAGVSGLKSHQTRMDVVSNNISNVNTVGFKSSRVTFAEMMNQTLQDAQAPQDNRGGVNPQQIGLGVDIASIDTNQTQGSLESTGIGTDLAIDGDGLFRLNDGQQNFYTRAGNFTVDEDGTLVSSSNGYKVQGWNADDEGNINTEGDVGDLEIPIGDSITGAATKEAEFTGNLDSRVDVGYERSTTVDFFDSQGYKHTASLNLTRNSIDGNPNYWEVDLNSVTDSSGANLDIPAGSGGRIAFNTDGSFDEDESDDISIQFDPDKGAEAGQTVELDFSRLSQSSGEFSIDGTADDGYEFGFLDSFAIDGRGLVTGNYTNGMNQNIGQVGLANFSNPSGLVKEGDTVFRESQNSGEAQFGEATLGGRGEIAPGTLEMSNVDLAEQFTNMIVTQRGFQANSRSITTSDEMLQELTNLKR